jgi:deoxyribodipyrimidine photo-lyase
LLDAIKLDRSVGTTHGFHGGSGEEMRRLRRFIRDGLRDYPQARNHPEVEGTSRLSAYLPFGHLGPHSVALVVRDADAPRPVRDAFLEQLIVRRELAINFVRFNPNYDRLEAGEDWALCTLKSLRAIAAHTDIRRRSSREPRPTTRCGTPRSFRW